MKELLELSGQDLLKHPRVVDAADGLHVELWEIVGEVYLLRVLKSLEEVAFDMRDALMSQKYCCYDWASDLSKIIKANAEYCLGYSGPEHWIITATLVWENEQ